MNKNPPQVARAAASLLEVLDSGLRPKISRRLVPHNEFRRDIWGKFDPDIAIEYLASKELTFPGHKEAVFHALCCWVAAPHNALLVKSAVAQSVLKSISDAEKGARQEDSVIEGMESDLLARFGYLGGDFLKEVYYPLGGAQAFMRMLAIKDFRAALEKSYGHLLYAIKMFEIMHFHLGHFGKGRGYGRPSINKSSELIGLLKVQFGNDKKSPVQRSVSEYWYRYRDSIVFAYAAYTIKIDEDSNLLEQIVRSKVSYDLGMEHFDLWMRRAKYALDIIVPHGADINSSERTETEIPYEDFEAFEPPTFSENDIKIIGKAYKRGAVGPVL